MKVNSYYFLASPYNGPEEEKLRRYKLSRKIAAKMLEQSISLFAPIVYNQTLIEEFPKQELESRRRLLMPMNIDFLINARAMILLKLAGWEESWGISQYLEICSRENIQVYDLYEETLESDLNQLINKFSHSNTILATEDQK